jgi:uncharacterized protein YqgC (DUF456 family)
MVYVLLFTLVVVNTVWLALVVFGLPGNWLIVLSTCLFAWWQWDAGVFSIGTLVAIGILALLGEAVEFLAGAAGARGSGAGWLGSMAAVPGAVVGAVSGTFLIAVPLLGTVLGACLGAGVAAWAVEIARGQHREHSLRRGVGAGLGAFLGITSKLLAGVVIWMVVAVAAFWP